MLQLTATLTTYGLHVFLMNIVTLKTISASSKFAHKEILTVEVDSAIIQRKSVFRATLVYHAVMVIFAREILLVLKFNVPKILSAQTILRIAT